jgi:hypothetical protein
MLIEADDIKEARERLEEKMEGTTIDVEVVKIEETAILEVITDNIVCGVDFGDGDDMQITGTIDIRSDSTTTTTTTNDDL